MTTITNNELYLKLKYGGVLDAFEATAKTPDTEDYKIATQIMAEWLRELREERLAKQEKANLTNE